MKFLAINMGGKSVKDAELLMDISVDFGFELVTKKALYLDVYKSTVENYNMFNRFLLSEDKNMYLEDKAFKEPGVVREVSFDDYIAMVS